MVKRVKGYCFEDINYVLCRQNTMNIKETSCHYFVLNVFYFHLTTVYSHSKIHITYHNSYSGGRLKRGDYGTF